MKKIKVELSPDELASLIHIIGEKEREVQNQTLNNKLSFGLTAQLTLNLTEPQKEEIIKVQVKATISQLTGIQPDQMKNDDRLVWDLGMTKLQIASLAFPFTSIARQYKANVKISSDECENQATIQDCTNLIMNKIK